MNNRTIPPKAVLEQLYTVEKLPMYRVAEVLNMSVGKIHRFITAYGIQPREKGCKGYKHTPEALERMSLVRKGKKLTEEHKQKIRDARFGMFKYNTEFGGHRKKRTDGYVYVYTPNHPKATKDGYAMEHILVMEKHIGRHLTEDEVVHHINKIRDDNRIENLALMTKSTHASLHNKERHEKRKD